MENPDARKQKSDPVAPLADAVVHGEAGESGFTVTPEAGNNRILLKTPQFETVKLSKGLSVRLDGKEGFFGPSGAPDLPSQVVVLEGREGFRPEISVLNQDSVDHADMEIAPRESRWREIKGHRDVDFVDDRRQNPTIYGTDEFYPKDLVTVTEGKMRDRHFVRIEYHPLQFNPKTGVLRQHKSIESLVKWVPIDAQKNAAVDEFGFQIAATSDPATGTDIIDSDCACSERVTTGDALIPEWSLTKPSGDGVASEYRARFPGMNAEICAKVRVDETGVHRINASTLLGAPFRINPSQLVGSRIRMYTRDREISIFVSRTGQFTSSDYILFYGEEFEGFYDDANVYWIGFSDVNGGKRWSENEVEDTIESRSVPRFSFGASQVNSACRQVSHRDKGVWAPSLNNHDEWFDGWTSALLQGLTAGTPAYEVRVPHTDKVIGNFSLRVLLRGRGIRQHTVTVRNKVTGSTIASFSFFGEGEHWLERNDLPASRLSNSAGGTTLQFYTSGSADLVYLDRFILQAQRTLSESGTFNGTGFQDRGAWVSGRSYSVNNVVQNETGRSYVATRSHTSGSNTRPGFGVAGIGVPPVWNQYWELLARDTRFTFGGRAGRNNYDVEGLPFSSVAQYYLLDVTDPTTPKRLTGFSLESFGGRFRLRMGDDTSYAACYHLSPITQVMTVPSADIELVRFRNLADEARDADYIMVVPKAFVASGSMAYDLLKHRAMPSQDGFKVLMAPVEDIYNEFGYGIKDARAVKQFIGFAYHHYQNKPRYVLLMGDGKYDVLEKEVQLETVLNTINQFVNRVRSKGHPDHIPVWARDTSFVFTALDTWFAAVDGPDDLPDMAIGRMPVETLTEVATAVTKTMAFDNYNSLSGRNRVVLLADEGGQFKADSEELRTRFFPSSWSTSGHMKQLYLDDSSYTALNTRIFSELNAGALVLNYNGHGAPQSMAQRPAGYLWRVDLDLPKMNNNIHPIFNVFTCNAGIFQEPPLDIKPGDFGSQTVIGEGCLAEAMLRFNNRGNAAGVYSTAESQPRVAEIMSQEFYHAITKSRIVVGYSSPNLVYNTQVTRKIGDGLVNGMLAVQFYLGPQEEIKFYNVFGDPALDMIP